MARDVWSSSWVLGLLVLVLGAGATASQLGSFKNKCNQLGLSIRIGIDGP